MCTCPLPENVIIICTGLASPGQGGSPNRGGNPLGRDCQRRRPPLPNLTPHTRGQSRQVCDLCRNCQEPSDKHLMSHLRRCLGRPGKGGGHPSVKLPRQAWRLSQPRRSCSPNWPAAVLSSFIFISEKEKNKANPKACSRSRAGGPELVVLSFPEGRERGQRGRGPLEGTLSSPRTGCAGRVPRPSLAPASIQDPQWGRWGEEGRSTGRVVPTGTGIQGPKDGLGDRRMHGDRDMVSGDGGDGD